MKTSFSIALLAALLAVTLSAVSAEKAPLPLPKEVSGYTSWKRINTKPLRLPDQTAQLCAASVPAQPNPHRQYWFNVYVNKKGEKAMQKPKSPVFPVGTTIVKEKLKEENATTPAVRTVMIKRERGFDRETGDWEYLVIGLKGGVTRDTIIREKVRTLSHCRSCHEKVKGNDYVFRTYLPKPLRKTPTL